MRWTQVVDAESQFSVWGGYICRYSAPRFGPPYLERVPYPIGVRAVECSTGLLVISQKGGNRPIERTQPFEVEHRVPLIRKVSRQRDIIRVLAEGRCSGAALPALNPENRCGVNYTPLHSRSDGCTHTHTLHV